MKAIVYTGNGGWELKQVPEPEIRRPDDVKVRVDMACICGSDLSILNGRYLIDPGVILGHELTGLVLAAGPAVSRLRVGDRVVLAPNVPCHTCSTCMSGHENLCPNMKSYGENLDGGFAPFFVAPESQLYPVPEHVEPRVAAFAEPLACVLNAVGQLPVSPGQRALVLGAGPTGLLFIKCLIANGVDEIYVSAHGELRRQTAKDCGAIPIDDTSPAEDLFSVRTDTAPTSSSTPSARCCRKLCDAQHMAVMLYYLAFICSTVLLFNLQIWSSKACTYMDPI